MKRYESDVCIIGGGITAAMLSEKLLELRPGLSIAVVEAGNKFFDLAARMQARERSIRYAENPWPGDFIEDQAAKGVISRTMAVGGSALHWGGTCNRFSEEDLRLRSMYGLHVDWPLEWTELEKFYCEAERRLGVSGEPSPLPEDRRSEPYPMPAMVMSHNLIELKKWAEQSGIPFWTTPQAKNTRPYDGRAPCIRCNTCSICPTGARYSPDFTFKRLLAGKNFALHERTLVRKLVLDDSKPTIAAAQAVNRDAPGDPIEYRAPVFVLASGYCWSPHLLLLSQCSRFPDGLANRSQLVGRYMCGHAFISAQIEIDAKIYPGMNEQHGLISRQFFRCRPDAPFLRHDLRIWESAAGHDPRLRSAGGRLLLGDDLLADWRERAKRGTARVRGYYDVHPDRDSSLTLDDIVAQPLGRSPAQNRTQARCGFAGPPAIHPRPLPAAFSKAVTGGQWEDPQHQRGQLLGPSGGRLPHGQRTRHERLRQSRPDPRSREPLRGRFAHAAQRRMHQRHPHVCGVDAAFGGAHRGKVSQTGMKTACVLALLSALAAAQEWPSYGGDPGQTHYSELARINRNNVRNLKRAWEWKTGEAPLPEFKTTPGMFEATPLMTGGVLYLSTPYNRVVALDAATGREVWSYDPKAYTDGQPPNGTGFVHRGVAAWRDGKTGKLRIFMNSRARLISLDAETGKPAPDFGDNGIVNLVAGLRWETDPKQYTNTSPPVVYKDLVIVGNGVADRMVFRKDPPGDVRAFDARTGKLVWTFYTVPRSGEFGSDTWGQRIGEIHRPHQRLGAHDTGRRSAACCICR